MYYNLCFARSRSFCDTYFDSISKNTRSPCGMVSLSVIANSFQIPTGADRLQFSMRNLQCTGFSGSSRKLLIIYRNPSGLGVVFARERAAINNDVTCAPV